MDSKVKKIAGNLKNLKKECKKSKIVVIYIYFLFLFLFLHLRRRFDSLEDRLQKMESCESTACDYREKRYRSKRRVFLASVQSSCRVHARLSIHACRLRSNPQQWVVLVFSQ